MALNFNFGDVIITLQEAGVFEYVLPFLLIFAILFAILEKTQVFGTDKTNVNVVVATVIGLLVLVQPDIIKTINLFLPRVSLIIVVILMFLLIISMIAGNTFSGLKGHVFAIAVVVVIIAVIVALTLPSSGSFGFYLSQNDRDALLSIGLPMLLFFLVLGLITKKPNKGNDNPIGKFLTGLTRGAGGQA